MSWLSQMLPPTDDPNKFLDEYVKGLTAQTEAARKATTNRYFRDVKAQKKAIRGSQKQQRANVGLLRGQEREALQQNAERFNNLGTQNEQDLLDRGLTNSSALATLRTGMEGERRRAATDISNTAKMNILATRQYGQARTDNLRSQLHATRASRNDIGPDTSQLASLAQLAGQQTGEQRQRSLSQIQGMLGGLFGQQGQYPGLMGGPGLLAPQQQQTQQPNILGSILGQIPGIGPILGGLFR